MLNDPNIIKGPPPGMRPPITYGGSPNRVGSGGRGLDRPGIIPNPRPDVPTRLITDGKIINQGVVPDDVLQRILAAGISTPSRNTQQNASTPPAAPPPNAANSKPQGAPTRKELQDIHEAIFGKPRDVVYKDSNKLRELAANGDPRAKEIVDGLDRYRQMEQGIISNQKEKDLEKLFNSPEPAKPTPSRPTSSNSGMVSQQEATRLANEDPERYDQLKRAGQLPGSKFAPPKGKAPKRGESQSVPDPAAMKPIIVPPKVTTQNQTTIKNPGDNRSITSSSGGGNTNLPRKPQKTTRPMTPEEMRAASVHHAKNQISAIQKALAQQDTRNTGGFTYGGPRVSAADLQKHLAVLSGAGGGGAGRGGGGGGRRGGGRGGSGGRGLTAKERNDLADKRAAEAARREDRGGLSEAAYREKQRDAQWKNTPKLSDPKNQPSVPATDAWQYNVPQSDGFGGPIPMPDVPLPQIGPSASASTGGSGQGDASGALIGWLKKRKLGLV